MPLLVCRTCPRDEPGSGSFGSRFDDAAVDGASTRGVRVRHVPCLGGCPNAGNIALDAPGKARVRFSHITPADADAVLDAASGYDASSTGDPRDWTVPAELAGRLTAVTPKGLRLPADRDVRGCRLS